MDRRKPVLIKYLPDMGFTRNDYVQVSCQTSGWTENSGTSCIYIFRYDLTLIDTRPSSGPYTAAPQVIIPSKTYQFYHGAPPNQHLLQNKPPYIETFATL